MASFMPDFNALRRNNIFNNIGNASFLPQQNIDNSQQPIADPVGQPNTPLVNYTPQNQDSNAYRNDVNNAPDPNNYKPSLLRKIAASLAGLGNPQGYEIAHDIATRPYQDAVGQYQAKLKNELPLVTNEQRSNELNKTLAVQEAIRQQEQQKIEEANRKNMANETLAQTKEADAKADKDRLRNLEERNSTTKEHNAAINDFKAHNSHAIIKEIPGGNLVAIDPITNKTTDLLGSDGKPIASGKLDDLTKARIGLENQLAEIRARIKGQEDVKGTPSYKDLNLGDQLGSTSTATTTVDQGHTIPGSGIFGTNILGTKTSPSKTTTTVKTPNKKVTAAPNTILMDDGSGNHFSVSPDQMDAFMKKFPNAKKVGG